MKSAGSETLPFAIAVPASHRAVPHKCIQSRWPTSPALTAIDAARRHLLHGYAEQKRFSYVVTAWNLIEIVGGPESGRSDCCLCHHMAMTMSRIISFPVMAVDESPIARLQAIKLPCSWDG